MKIYPEVRDVSYEYDGAVCHITVRDGYGEFHRYPVHVMEDGTLKMVRPASQDDKN